MKQHSLRRTLAEIALAAATIIGLLASLYAAGTRLMPHRYDYGSVWESYLEETPNSLDALFFGSSMCYCDVVPAVLYERSGLTSFVMAGPEQTPEVMNAYVREACRTQSPKCVVAELNGAFFDATTGYSKVNVCYMPFSANRLRAALACEEGIFRLAVFPIYDFHSEITAPQASITDLTAEDGRMLAGYTELREAGTDLEMGDREGLQLPGSEAFEGHARALEDLAAYCRDEGIELICYFAPALLHAPESARSELTERLRAAGCAQIWDFTDSADEMGIDLAADWYDALHFNRFGAEKFSAFLAQRLAAFSGGGADTALWQQRVEYFHRPVS